MFFKKNQTHSIFRSQIPILDSIPKTSLGSFQMTQWCSKKRAESEKYFLPLCNLFKKILR